MSSTFNKNLFGLLVSTMLLFSQRPVIAQEPTADKSGTPYETAFKDYQSQITEYQIAHQDYILRRSQYLRFKTLQSQQDARDATVKMMQERDDVVVSYLETIKERLKEAPGVNDIRRNGLNVRIDAEVGWFTDHKGRIPSAGTLDDLVKDNKTAQERFDKAQPVFYESLSVVTSGKITDYDERLKDLFTKLKDKVNLIKSEDREDFMLADTQLQNLDRWIFNADNTFLRAEEKQIEGDNLSLTMINQKNKSTNIYSSVLQKYSESQQFLRESGNYLIEIVREIKTKI